MNPYIARIHATFEDSERASPEELSRQQAARLEAIVSHAYVRAPFYRDRLACLFSKDGGFNLARWQDVPVTDRDDALAQTTAMRVAELPAEKYGEIGEFPTSGTTGKPLDVAVNALVSLTANAGVARLARWFRLDPARDMAAIKIFPGDEGARFPHGKVGKSWIIGYPGSLYGLTITTPVNEQLEWLARITAPYLSTYPSNALALAEAVSPERGRSLGIEMVIGHGETITDGTRELVAERFGARFASLYSCVETGIIASECADGRYHVAVENVLVEILDEKGDNVGPGERGRVVVTGLTNYAMPFIRYGLNDFAVAAEAPCPCGRYLPTITRVEGRIRNAFTLHDGTRIWPRGWLARDMKQFVPYQQFQMVQLTHKQIEFRYVPDGSGRTPDLEGLVSYTKRQMHPSLAITALAMDSLPRGPNGKFEDFVSLVPVGVGLRVRSEG